MSRKRSTLSFSNVLLPIPGLLLDGGTIVKVLKRVCVANLIASGSQCREPPQVHAGYVPEQLHFIHFPTQLGGSWVLIRRVNSRVTILITRIRGLITPLITTPEPPRTPHQHRQRHLHYQPCHEHAPAY